MKELLRLRWRQQNSPQKNESTWAKVMKGSILIAFLAGILLANLMGREEISNAGILNDYFIEKFKYTGVNGESLFFYILKERVPVMVLLFLLAFSSLGMISGILFLGWQGFSIGFMMSTAIAKYGGKGIFLILGGLFPQYLFYIPVYILYCYFALFLQKRIYGEQRNSLTAGERGKIYGIGVLVALILLFIFIAGIFLESYINPSVLKKVLKIF